MLKKLLSKYGPLRERDVAEHLLKFLTSYVVMSNLHKERHQILLKYLEKMFANVIITVQHILAKKKKTLKIFFLRRFCCHHKLSHWLIFCQECATGAFTDFLPIIVVDKIIISRLLLFQSYFALTVNQKFFIFLLDVLGMWAVTL